MAITSRHLQALADAGATAQQLVALVKADEAIRLERRLYLAVRRALFAPSESAFAAVKPDTVPAPVEPGYRSSPVKSAARAGLLASRVLRPAARRVGARLVERLNLETGRCDPSIASLAEDTGYDARSVRRALAELEEVGLIRREVHAGRGHTNAFTLDLEAMGAIAARAAPRKADSRGWRAPEQQRNGQKRTPESGKPDARVRQNRVQKQSPVAPRARPDPAQPQMFFPIDGAARASTRDGRHSGVTRPAAAQAAAVRRVMDDIEREARGSPGFNVSGLTQAQWADVHAAEQHRQGTGIELIRSMLATGPPKVASGG